jgi:signal transduction histidine kinase
MDYSPLIAQVPSLSSKALAGLLFLAAVLIIVATLFIIIWRKLRENEVMKKEFITIVAHKFRTPLTQMRWLTESLLTDEKDGYKRQNLEEMQKVNKGLIDLTGTLIELTESSRGSKSSYTFERGELSALVRSVGDSLKEAFKEKNLFFGIQCPADQVFVKMDKGRLEFVLQTLLGNALTYTPSGRNVNVTVTHGGGKAVVAVTDQGIGIDKADLPHIFSKFYRTDNAQRTDTEGFGVGLYLSQSIIRRHRGKLEVYSEGLNKGTTFTVTLNEVK